MKTQQLEIKLSNKTEEDIKKARRKSTQAGECGAIAHPSSFGEGTTARRKLGAGVPGGDIPQSGAWGQEQARLSPGESGPWTPPILPHGGLRPAQALALPIAWKAGASSLCAAPGRSTNPTHPNGHTPQVHLPQPKADISSHKITSFLSP